MFLTQSLRTVCVLQWGARGNHTRERQTASELKTTSVNLFGDRAKTSLSLELTTATSLRNTARVEKLITPGN